MITLVLRLVFSLGVVLGLMYLAGRVMRRRGIGVTRSTRDGIEVIARKGLSKHASVAILHVAGRRVLVGVTDQRVTLLSELEDELAAPSDDAIEEIVLDQERHGTAFFTKTSSLATPSNPARKGLLDTLREMTVRRA
ncbi:MAG: FliO/MopB family protein [Acidimicrobiia bacterium]